MDLRLTIASPRRVGTLTDVVVTAPPGTPLRAVLPELLTVVGADGEPAEINCGGTPVGAHHPLGVAPLLQGAVLVLGASEQEGPALLQAQAVAGPDAGSTWPLRAGGNVVGRSSPSLIRPEDEDVSREHAEIVVEAGRVTVRDLGSTNGTWVGGRRLAPDEVIDLMGREVRVGASVLVVGRAPRPPAATVADGAGQVRVNRRPDLRPGRRTTEISFPVRPAERGPTRLPWPALLLPLLLAVPLAVFWHQPAFLAFALMSPLMVAGQFLYDRRSGRREAAARVSRWQEMTAETEKRLAAVVVEDAERLHDLRPDLAGLAEAATTPTDDLWRRSPGDPAFLHLRLGRGPGASGIRVRRPEDDVGLEGIVHPDVPVVVDLPEVAVLGVCGPRAAVLGAACSLVGQVAVLHAPGDVRVTVLVADASDRAGWQWAGRLPHHSEGVGDRGVAHVVVLDGARALRDDPSVGLLLGAAANARKKRPVAGTAAVLVICLAGSEQELPVECGATVVLDDRWGRLHSPGAEAVRFAPDLAGARWSERVSRGLAPLREAVVTGADELPDDVRLVDLIGGPGGFDPARPADLATHWRRSGPRGPTALIGEDAAGAVRIDLRRDGPHVLLGGTTGAGKSELLQTMIAGLAVDSGPDEISFLLVDYKGGAAFRECLGLPHVTGLITDLDPRLAARALTSLRAELQRRERLLAGSGAVDVDEHVRQGGRLPRLIVVVDEFRVLAEELPDFVSGLVRVAAVGRSLGVHLVLATQRPAGIVSPEIAANTNLRIALRLRDDGDSRDLVDDPAAARLPADRPGRALLRAGSGEVQVMQAARVRCERRAAPGAGDRPSVRLAPPFPFTVAGETRAPASAGVSTGAGSGTDLAAVIEACRRATDGLGLDRPSPPWLPPLPELVTDVAPGAIGLKDRPEHQDQVPLTWALDGRHLAVAGGPRSGRTTTARTLASAAAGAGAHVYVVDGAGALADLEAVPGVEGVLGVRDLERCRRLVTRLRRAVVAKQERVVVVIDGWENLLSAWNDHDHGRLVDDLTALLRDGPAAGLQVAVTGGRTLLTGSVSALLSERLVLRFADPADAVLAGVRSELVSRSMPPGRAVHLGPDDPDGHEVHLARCTPVPRTGATRAASEWAVPELPSTLTLDELWAYPDADRTALPLGVGGEAAALIGLEPVPLTVVLGPAGSGRSTTLRCLAESLRRGGRPGVSVALSGPEGRDPRTPDRVADALRKGVTVLVDDARGPSSMGDSPADRTGDVIVEHLARAPDSGPAIVLACSPADVLAGFRGLPVVARGARQGLVLGNAGAAAAEVLGVRVAAYPGAPPGRAMLVRDGRSTVVQLPRAPAEVSVAAGR